MGAGDVDSEGEHGPARLERALRGRLPCVVCKYDLRGLSVRGVCPECGTAVRATILYEVDPHAEEFEPILHPKLTSTALVVWAMAALVATGAIWWPRIVDVVSKVALVHPPVAIASWVAVVSTGISGAAVLFLLRPTRRTAWQTTLAALAGACAYVPLVWTMHRMVLLIDSRGRMPYLGPPAQQDSLVIHLLFCVSLIVCVLGVRPIIRGFVRRSMAMRTKRVDRQTLLAMAATAGLMIVGDIVRLVFARVAAGASTGSGGSGAADLVQWGDLVGQMIVGLASGLFALGMIGAVRDSWRLRRVILLPAPSLGQLLESDEETKAAD